MKRSDHPSIIVGLSGGVDSAVAAWLLIRQGYQVRGVFMRNWSEVGEGCNWEWDFESAKHVAEHLSIPLSLWDFEQEYRKEVFEPFLESFARGETPNPDIACNRHVKFGAFLRRAQQEGADWVATGHYARITADHCRLPHLSPTSINAESDFVYHLMAAKDSTKDQSYFLALLNQAQLASTLFPLGRLTKKEVRALAHTARLPNAARRDSFGICFIGAQHMNDFLRPRVPASPGPIITTQGETIGMHEGLPFYTIGQRKGIGIGGTGPYYVVEKKVALNTLVVTAHPRDPALFDDHALILSPHWIEGVPTLPAKCLARHRHLQPLQTTTIEPFGAHGIKVLFDAPQRAITPGQFLALYDGEVCLGGGTIAQRDIL